MALVRLSSLPEPDAADLGGFPNTVGWPVFGRNGRAVGRVVDMYLHGDLGGVVSLAVKPGGAEQEFAVPADEVEVDRQHQQVRVHRNLSEFPPLPPRAHDRPFLLRALLDDYGVDEDTIDALEAAGILTMERLRAVTQRGGLAPLLGPARREQARKVERVVREQQL